MKPAIPRPSLVLAAALCVAAVGARLSNADPPFRGDINGDGQINFADINSFVECLTQGVCPNRWIKQEPQTRPPGRYGTTMVYDSDRGVIVLVGGWHGHVRNDMWEWEDSTWKEVIPDGSPWPTRYGHAMVYDSYRHVIVLFGGFNEEKMHGDTWEYDGKSWSLRATTGPSPRAVTMAYDSAHHQVMLFGGAAWDGSQWFSLGDTWLWDGEAQRWEQRFPPTSPPARNGQGVAYDSERKRVVLYGGYSSERGEFLHDTWEWDGSNQTWTKVSEVGPPAGIVDNRLQYDSHRGVVVLSVIDAYPSYHPETWEWDGTTWRKAKSIGPGVAVDGRGAMAYDADHATMLLFGGYPTIDETWQYRPR